MLSLKSRTPVTSVEDQRKFLKDLSNRVLMIFEEKSSMMARPVELASAYALAAQADDALNIWENAYKRSLDAVESADYFDNMEKQKYQLRKSFRPIAELTSNDAVELLSGYSRLIIAQSVQYSHCELGEIN